MMNIGNDEQRKKYVDAIAEMSMLGTVDGFLFVANDSIGGFALTELGHGSNAKDIETIAEYDAISKEFVLQTPTETAQKMFIGNLACNANHMTVFAQVRLP
jgi:alkylation response protein AidB-like acyl-CoA dehydrogenase